MGHKSRPTLDTNCNVLGDACTGTRCRRLVCEKHLQSCNGACFRQALLCLHTICSFLQSGMAARQHALCLTDVTGLKSNAGIHASWHDEHFNSICKSCQVICNAGRNVKGKQLIHPHCLLPAQSLTLYVVASSQLVCSSGLQITLDPS